MNDEKRRRGGQAFRISCVFGTANGIVCSTVEHGEPGVQIGVGYHMQRGAEREVNGW
jgi:hypothetical protein